MGHGHELVDRLVLTTLHTAVLHPMLDHGLCELRYAGRRSGLLVSLPVQYARHGADVVVYVGRSAGKAWWRNFAQPYPIEVVIRGDRYPGIANVVRAGAPDRSTVSQIYRGAYARARTADADPFVLITLVTDGSVT